jgi:hypothetical protein
MSGRYHFDPKPDDPNLKNFQAYFGADGTRYSAQSPINYVKAAKPLPTFIVISEYDNPDLDTQGALLFGALCERDARAHVSRAWSCTIIFRWSTNSIQMTMNWAVKSWNSSGAVVDLDKSRPKASGVEGNLSEAPRSEPGASGRSG